MAEETKNFEETTDKNTNINVPDIITEESKDNTSFFALPIVEEISQETRKISHFLGIDLCVARCNQCNEPVSSDYADANGESIDNDNEESRTPRTPSGNQQEWTETFRDQRNMKKTNDSKQKTKEEYERSLFTTEDESSARLYAEMECLENDSCNAGANTIVSEAVKRAVTHH